MESVKKWLSERTAKKNGIYVHYSPPKLLGVVSAAQLRQWARGGAEEKLERAVLAGQGRRLLAEAEALPLSHHLPALIAKCDALHAAVEKGSLLELQELLDSDYNRRKYVMCRDEAGAGLLHKAIYYDYMDIAEWLVKHYPQLVHQKDSEGRTPLHYAAVCRDEAAAAALLEGAGAARGARDAAGRTPAHYRGPARTLLTLPAPADMAPEPVKNPPGLVIKRHNIRIWCHDCDMARLQRVVWEGHGTRLLSEVCNQPVVKKFLEAVPYIMNTIRDIHNVVVKNDLEGLIKHAGDPVPPQALSCRDGNNMTVLHKAAGLGHGGILKWVAERYPQGINAVDNDGRTALHYAAAVKDDRHAYNTLVSLGADEGAVDNKNRTPAYYLSRPQEIDKSVFNTLPDAPRTASSAYPPSWDWSLLDTEVVAEMNNKKTKKKNLKASNENISSRNNTNTLSDSTDQLGGMKASSTQELIKDLPELNDSSIKKPKVPKRNKNVAHNKEMEEVESKSLPVPEEKHEEKEVEEPAEEATEILEDTHVIAEGEHENDNNDAKEHEQEPEVCKPEEDEPESNENEHNKTHDNNLTEKEENAEEKKNESKAEENENQQDTETHEDQSDEDAHSEQHDKESEFHNVDKSVNEKENEDNEETKQSVEEKISERVDDKEQDTKEQTIEKDKEQDEENDHDEGKTLDENKKVEEETGATKLEGNNNTDHSDHNGHNNHKGHNDHNEDDDDVQVQADSHSEYSDTNLRSTAEVSDTGSAKRGNVTNGRNTQESLIEGIISADAEQDSQDASITENEESVHGNLLIVDNEIDPEVTELINSANMEMLAALVLNGEGARLVGRSSRNSELQAFLDNVPTYMQKINKVHLAAKEGNIRDLQAALDRRKFAIARDPISPNGGTPLHVATVCGKTNIMKYLGGRFPETLSAVDFEGRTALHYAAVLPDNGYYYNLLQQLGANSKDLDDGGHSAEDYLKNPKLLPYKQLITDFGISEEEAQEMMADKVPEDHVSSRRNLDVPEALDTLERCYRLLASARPARTPLSASSNRAIPPLVLGRFLKRPIFEAIKYRVTKLDHDLFDIIWPAVKKLPDNRNIVQTVEEDFPGGITAPDYYVYGVFREFLIPLIKDLHNINVNSDLPLHPLSKFLTSKPLSGITTEPLVELNIDPNEEFVLSGTIECSRNLSGFELPLNLKVGKLETIERIITTILMQDHFAKLSEQPNPESDQKGGTYYTLNEVLEKPSEICATLASNGLLIALCDKEEIDDCSRLHGRHWPYGRGVFVSDDKTVAVWINVHDHLRVITATSADAPGEIGLSYSKMSYIMSYLHEKIDFVWDKKLGHLSSRPTFLGAGIRISLIINFPGLSKDSENMKHLCAMRGLQYRETLSPGIVRVSNYQCLSITETNCFNDFATATSNLLQLEKELSMQNSAHIATMLTNIFKRKRSSLTELQSPEKHNKQ